MDNAERIAKIEAIHALLASPRTTRSERVALEQQLAQLQQPPSDQSAATDAHAREAAIVAEFNAWMEELRNRPSKPVPTATSPESGIQAAPVPPIPSPARSIPQTAPPPPTVPAFVANLPPLVREAWAKYENSAPERKEPLYYRVLGPSGRTLTILDIWDHKTLTQQYETTLRSIQRCVNDHRHERQHRCSCWSGWRDWYSALRADTPLQIAASQLWDSLADYAATAKKSEGLDPLQQQLSHLTSALENLQLQQRPSWLDTRRAEGSKLTQRLRDEAKAARKLGGT